MMLKLPPIVVIHVPERMKGDRYADLTSAVRHLADEYGLRVIVDGTPNSIPQQLLETKRETVFHVEPMSRDQIESIPELKDLIDFLKVHHLEDAVWKVLGGSPIDYLNLKHIFDHTLSDNIVDEIKNYLQSTLSNALNRDICHCSFKTQQIIKLFRERNIVKISLSELAEMGLLQDNYDRIFREVNTSNEWVVEPHSFAVSLIISENINSCNGIIEVLQKFYNTRQ
jgi:hypothetical protein